jgi:hypothetical protein
MTGIGVGQSMLSHARLLSLVGADAPVTSCSSHDRSADSLLNADLGEHSAHARWAFARPEEPHIASGLQISVPAGLVNLRHMYSIRRPIGTSTALVEQHLNVIVVLGSSLQTQRLAPNGDRNI